MAEKALRKQHQAWRRKREVADVSARIELQKQQLMERTRQVEEASSFVEAAHDHNEDQQQQAREAQIRLKKAKAAVQQHREKLRQDRIISEDLRAMLARRRAEYAAALLETYPIGTDDAGEWCICGLRIQEEEALSMVARVLSVLARISAVPLRYPGQNQRSTLGSAQPGGYTGRGAAGTRCAVA
ncbi:hypothetical protein DL89DRAFT_172037 [Linderina pennispora]|uniref:Uncharacterized protein n=1 Tax=Linderina pennispora TaxID=61395 RepID=A0A1Y1W6J7_9FUNG|nr:uncharacterized protein DL89DRAFT_172037 [Linderina pennispora]ORX69141.1 hypothetical protein DL89DRAFT_172037 [Linderina pennispora]